MSKLSIAALSLAALPVASQGSAYDGLTLFQPFGSTSTYLMDNSGTIVHEWPGSYFVGRSVYLREDGTLLRSIKNHATGPSAGPARIQLVAWDGTLLWDYVHPDPTLRRHHDVELLPNGNVLTIAWRDMTDAEAIQAGRNPALITGTVFSPDSILEIEPVGLTGGNVVWEWNVIDHVVQEFDATKDNYGVVAEHPELIDLNFPPVPVGDDWNHLNAVEYNAVLDQIIVSNRPNSELWVIDHSTTTAEAAGHTGGDSGRGGDLLYRWGNPLAYQAGGAADQQCFGQHNPTWIPEGYPGAGNILLFDNGFGNPAGQFSRVLELVPPVDAQGNYSLTPGSAFGPAAPVWTYVAPTPTDFYSPFISGCQRLPSGNTLVCSGAQSWFFEVTPLGETVWEHVNTLPADGSTLVFRAEKYHPCIGSGTEALEVVRLGTPPNPDALRPGASWGPVLGAVWDPYVDHASFFPTALLDVLVVSLLTPVNAPTPLGTILCQIPPPDQIFVQAPIGAPFQVAIPDDCSLVGIPGSAQAGSLGGGVIQVTNALDVVFGTY